MDYGCIAIVAVLYLGFCACLGKYAAEPHNCSFAGFLFGLLGPFGVVAACFLRTGQRCATCGGLVDHPASLCPHCQRPLELYRAPTFEERLRQWF